MQHCHHYINFITICISEAMSESTIATFNSEDGDQDDSASGCDSDIERLPVPQPPPPAGGGGGPGGRRPKGRGKGLSAEQVAALSSEPPSDRIANALSRSASTSEISGDGTRAEEDRAKKEAEKKKENESDDVNPVEAAPIQREDEIQKKEDGHAEGEKKKADEKEVLPLPSIEVSKA